MKKVRLIISMCFAVGISMIWVTPVMASDLNKPAVIAPTKPTVVKVPDKEVKTTDTAIKFADGEYIRITQPINKDETKTFEKQLNVMGEARSGAKITIVVSYENQEQRLVSGKPISKTYELSDVGATQTFNQLIDLEVGKNKIVVKYEYGKVTGTEEIYIERQSEENKEKLKNFIANSPNSFSATTSK